MKRPFSVCLPEAPRGELVEKCDFFHTSISEAIAEGERERWPDRLIERIWNKREAINY